MSFVAPFLVYKKYLIILKKNCDEQEQASPVSF